ncbi:MAG: hypothetical protein M3Z19_14680, partial [Chloroflexota bacterium]|nr:hypothetical protein [Chloroflexota bacterium]
MHSAPDLIRSERVPAPTDPCDYPGLFVRTPPDPACEICVIVPVRDEARTLAETLRALADQRDVGGTLLDH